jgi:hypothetical protein
VKTTRRRLFGSVVATVSLAVFCGLARAEGNVPRQGTFEFYLGRYNIAEPLFKTIYQPGGSIKGVALTANLYSYFDFYLEIKGMVKNGLLSYSKEKTDFVLIPVSLGFRVCYPIAFINPFAGLGLDYFIFYEKNPIGTTLNYAKGWHLQSGVYFLIGKNFPVLPFAKIKYSFVNASAGGRAINLGGLEFGAGLAVAF